MTDKQRHQLAQAQRALVKALLDMGPIPEGFDEHAVKCAGQSLANKREKDALRKAALSSRSSEPEGHAQLKKNRWVRRLRFFKGHR